MKRKQFIIIGLLLLLVGGVFNRVFAAWLDNVPVTVVQPNGDTLHLFATGDEFYHYVHDAEGYTIMQHPETGYFVYADKVDDKLVPTQYIVGRSNPVRIIRSPRLNISYEEYMLRRMEMEGVNPYKRGVNRDPNRNRGEINHIVIFISFADDPTITNDYNGIDNMFNSSASGARSVYNYFKTVSYNNTNIFTTFYPSPNPDNGSIRCYVDSHESNYYRPYHWLTNRQGYRKEERREREIELLTNAIEYVNSNYPIPDALDLDWDDDGKVDVISFAINADIGGWDDLLWPHKWEFDDDTPIRINGEQPYLFTFELLKSNRFYLNTFCHELIHVFGAPDFYHGYFGISDYPDNPDPLSRWDIMCTSANPGFTGEEISNPGAYIKWKYLNWIDDIPFITEPGTYSLQSLGSQGENKAYRIASSTPNQYYVLEYRIKNEPFDENIFGSGLLVYRVNEDTKTCLYEGELIEYGGNVGAYPKRGWYDELYVFRPGGTLTNNGNLVNAFYSMESGRVAFNQGTDPAPFLSDGTPDRSISIFDISESGNTISFTYGYKINATTNNEDGGTVSGGGLYAYNSTCTLTATPKPGYIFKGWYSPAGLFPMYPLPTLTFSVSTHLNLIAKFQPATPTADLYQYYCWFDQDYSTVQTGSFQTVETFFSLDVSTLNEGLHTLHVMLNDNGLSAPKTYLFLKTPPVSPASTYTYHCWFDQDYSTVQTGSFGGEGYSFALDADELEDGIHTVHVMLEGNDLSASKTYIFLKAPVASSTETYTYHCWFDQDYETVQTGSFGGEGYSFAIDASNLDEGIHTMHVMLEGSEFSAAKTYLFLKAPVGSPTSTYTYHCWFDQDYTTVQTGTFGGEGYSFALDVDGIDNGLHFVNVMLEGNELSSAKRYLFCKKPIGGSGIYRWEYCLNGQWSDAVATTLVPTVQTLDILTMLPVDHLPIRSEDFEFEPNGGQPEIYAKNTITFRFWDDENRFLDRSAVYVDATVHEPVVADWIQRNTTETIATPAANHIHWFKLDAEVGDSLAFKSDVYCTMELFAPSGARQFKVMNAASVAFNGICANESGIYYLAVHDVEGSYESVSVTYLFLREMTAVTALNAGWNWWTPTVWTDISTLQSTLSDYLIQIQVQDEMPTGNINPGKMLKIQTSAACALSLRGMPITAASITVNPGATWFGYIGEEAPITQALNGFPPSVDDKIISQDGGFAIFNGDAWEGTLQTLVPGHGYVYVSNSATSKTLVIGE